MPHTEKTERQLWFYSYFNNQVYRNSHLMNFFFFSLISAKLKTQFSSRFKPNSSSHSRATSQLPQITGRSLSVHSHQTQNWTPAHHFPKRGPTTDAGCRDSPGACPGLQLDFSGREGLGCLCNASPCWEGLLRVSASPGLGWRSSEQTVTLWVSL